jgi:DNA mismatch repair protein MutS2
LQERTLRVLEYDKVIRRLAEKATSSLGYNLAMKVSPETDMGSITLLLKETSEARRILSSGERLPMGGIHDIYDLVSMAAIGRVLSAEDLFAIGTTLEAVSRLRETFKGREEEYPFLFRRVSELALFPKIWREISSAIGPAGEVLDSASPRLHSVRSQIRTLQNRIKDRLDSMIRSGENQKYLQESIVTIRNNRYVIPVKQEYKVLFPGIVHDQSASGATLFIEPMAIVEMNNQLRQVEADEEEEVYRILNQLSMQVGAVSKEIEMDLDILACLDLTVAKARLSIDMDGTEPELNNKGLIRLKSARHPLLTGKVVPIDIELGCDFSTLVITGPNTGGKTVSLKTVGLLVLMAQSGMHIPARYDSELAVFSGVFSDIGDEQSIEQSLSTFSSHMVQIVSILKEAGSNRDLVLLDELGAGTDPDEGAALAMVILNRLHARGVRTIATTHYSELKAFAYNTEGIQNASVEFDLDTLRPTYRLLQGIPGQSNAFAIAERLGLSNEIIGEARSILSPERRYVEDLIGRITDEKKQLETDLREASVLRSRLEKREKEHAAELEKLRNERQELIHKSKEEARDIVLKTRREMENLLRSLREAAPEEQKKVANQFRRKMEATLQELEEPKPSKSDKVINMPLQIGSEVELVQMGKNGVVLELNDTQAHVQSGTIKVWIDQDKLRPVSSPAKKSKAFTTIGALGREKAEQVSTELDLRGLLVEEALLKVDKYLDEAFLAGIPAVRLIHGKGTGALRAAIGEHLKTQPHVKSFRWGQDGEGGIGVTVAELNH